MKIWYILILFLIVGCKAEGVDHFTKEITEKDCEKADGMWDNCASPCAGQDVDYCIEMCAPACKCTMDDNCIVGSCNEKADICMLE